MKLKKIKPNYGQYQFSFYSYTNSVSLKWKWGHGNWQKCSIFLLINNKDQFWYNHASQENYSKVRTLKVSGFCMFMLAFFRCGNVWVAWRLIYLQLVLNSHAFHSDQNDNILLSQNFAEKWALDKGVHFPLQMFGWWIIWK